MNRKNLLYSTALFSSLGLSCILFAQAPTQNIDPQKNGSLAAAQASIVEAYRKIDAAQAYHKEQLGGHAEKAKGLLAQANQELKLAADYANAHNK